MVHLIRYNELGCYTNDPLETENVINEIQTDSVNWLDVDYAHPELVEKVGQIFQLHHLVIEDVTMIDLLPKSEILEDSYFLVLKMIKFDEKADEIDIEHVSMVLGEHYVITFQEGKEGDVFDQVRDKLISGTGRARKHKADYLFYLLVNTVADHYYVVLEKLRDKIDKLEDRILAAPTRNYAAEIVEIKREINTIRRYIVPLKDEIIRLKNDPVRFVKKATLSYFRDLSDRLLYLTTSFDTLREMLKELMDLHLSYVNNDMNQVMKTLTIISAIFIPLTFIVGVYGMNFDFMPELRWHWGYPLVLLGMFFLALLMAIYMKHKHWF